LAADVLSWCVELKPKDREDEKPTILRPLERFTEITAYEAELTDEGWDKLMDIFILVLAVTDVDILDKAWRLEETWEDNQRAWGGRMDWDRRIVKYGNC
jgi:hypothetical protein